VLEDCTVGALATDTQEMTSLARSKITLTLTAPECRDFNIDPRPTLDDFENG